MSWPGMDSCDSHLSPQGAMAPGGSSPCAPRQQLGCYGGDGFVSSAAPITATEHRCPHANPCVAHLQLFGRARPSQAVDVGAGLINPGRYSLTGRCIIAWARPQAQGSGQQGGYPQPGTCRYPPRSRGRSACV